MSDPALSRFHRFAAVVKDAVFLSSLIVGLSGAVGTTVVKMAWPHFIKQLQTDLSMATREDVQSLQAQINQISGENRIIKMPAGHSYVSEPVTLGDPIHMNLVMSRTKHGVACSYISGTPLFTDERGIPFAGQPVLPIKQLGLQPERLQLILDPPPVLQPGRVSVVLGMKYSCPFGPGGVMIDVYDETDIIFFQVDPA